MAKPHYLIAQIDIPAIEHNCRQLRSLIGPTCQLCVTVKGNAYGHGIEVVLPALQAAKVDMLAVATINEAQELRHLGWARPILLLGSELSIYDGPQKRQLAHWLVANDVRVSVTRKEEVAALATAARYVRQPAQVHLKLDTGMGRMGLKDDELWQLLEVIRDADKVVVEGIYTHFATADEPEQEFAREQLGIYQRFCQRLREQHINIPLRHTSNSSAAIAMPESHFDMIRPGLAVFGCLANADLHQRLDLKPAMRMVSCLTFVKHLPAGSTIGYGCTYKAPSDMLLGIVPIGYADGYSRRLSNVGQMLIAERAVPIIGRVSMDLTIVDLTGLEREGLTPQAGDDVVVIDSRRESPNSVENIARQIGGIPYEIVTQLGRRITRMPHNIAARVVRVNPHGGIQELPSRRLARNIPVSDMDAT